LALHCEGEIHQAMMPHGRLFFVAGPSLYYTVDWLRGQALGQPEPGGAGMKIDSTLTAIVTGGASGLMTREPIDTQRGVIVNTASAAATDGQMGEMIRNGYFNGETVRLDGAIRMQPR
jgi:hypothetical protein